MVTERRKAQIRKAQQTYRNKKRIERLLGIKNEKLEQSLPEVVEPLPDYNYLCPCGKDCKDSNYDCKLGDKYHTCKHFLKVYPLPQTSRSYFKEPSEEESSFYNGLRKRKDKYSVGIN